MNISLVALPELLQTVEQAVCPGCAPGAEGSFLNFLKSLSKQEAPAQTGWNPLFSLLSAQLGGVFQGIFQALAPTPFPLPSGVEGSAGTGSFPTGPGRALLNLMEIVMKASSVGAETEALKIPAFAPAALPPDSPATPVPEAILSGSGNPALAILQAGAGTEHPVPQNPVETMTEILVRIGPISFTLPDRPGESAPALPGTAANPELKAIPAEPAANPELKAIPAEPAANPEPEANPVVPDKAAVTVSKPAVPAEAPKANVPNGALEGATASVQAAETQGHEEAQPPGARPDFLRLLSRNGGNANEAELTRAVQPPGPSPSRESDPALPSRPSASAQAERVVPASGQALPAQGEPGDQKTGPLSSVILNLVERIRNLPASAPNPKYGSVQVNLEPPSLGRLTLHLSLDGNSVRVNMTAALPDAKALLDQHAEALKSHLASLGLSIQEFNISLGQQPQGHESSERFHPWPAFLAREEKETSLDPGARLSAVSLQTAVDYLV